MLAALRQRDLPDGKGQHITAGLYETSVYWVAQWMATAQYSDEPSIPISAIQQGTRMGFSIYRLFATADQSQVFIGVTSDAHWDRFCNAFALDDLHGDSRYRDSARRLANRPALNEAVAAAIAGYTLEQATVKLQAANIPFSPLHRPDQLANEAHLNASGQLIEVPMPHGRMARLPKLPFRSSAFDMPLRCAAPAHGAHTRELLVELGYSATAIEDLHARGQIGIA